MKVYYRVWIEKEGCWLAGTRDTLEGAIEYAKKDKERTNSMNEYTIQKVTTENVHTL